jgi:hypothetical protein
VGEGSWEPIVAPTNGAMDSYCKVIVLFDVQGAVAKSTFAGLPWLRYLRQQCKIHFWPFAGWDVPPGRSVRRLFAGDGDFECNDSITMSAPRPE